MITSTRTKTVLGLAGVTLMAITAGCSSGSDRLAEGITEKAIEQAGGGKVDIDAKNGSMDIKTEDGSMSFDEDGNFTMTDKDGGVTTSGSATDLPEGWPAEVELLKGAKIVSATTSTVDGAERMSVSANFNGDMKEVHASVKEQLEGAGFEIVGDSLSTSAEGGFGSLQATDDKLQVMVSLMGGGDEDESLISYTVTPAEEE